MTAKGFSLEIDSKLTVRVLKTSKSKKTILLNKGRSDELVPGDHAKFFVSEGVVARAVVVELSKKRSVWSVYRVINRDLLNSNEIMNIKITPKVKLTDDPLAVVSRDSSFSNTVDDKVADKEFQVYSDLFDDGKVPESQAKVAMTQELQELDLDISDKNFEIGATIGFQSYSSEVTGTTSNSDFTGSEFTNNVLISGEYYFESTGIFGYFQYLQESLLSFDGALTDSASLEFGGGINFYMFGDPHKANQLITYLTTGLGVGSITDTFSGGELASTAQTTVEVTGSTVALFGGIGFKYFLPSGFGMRFLIDLYRRQDSFNDDVPTITTTDWSRVRMGPRLLVGISYRM